ncbi:hypothetical protein LINPERPRIM_LOCUS17122 [Linum perenne]
MLWFILSYSGDTKCSVRSSRHQAEEFFFENEDILCRCGLQATRRISRTSLNPGRKFFGCPLFPIGGCDYFVWYEVKVAALAEKEELVRMVENLKLQVRQLQEENMQLQRYCEPQMSATSAGLQACTGSEEYDVVAQLEMLKYRVGVLETHGCGSDNHRRK